MKRAISFLLSVLLLLTVPFCASANDETVLTLEVPKGIAITYTGNVARDAFALAVGYSLSEDCVGLSGYALTVRWDPTVLALNTDYRENMTDDEMARSKGCYFRDLYDDGLLIAPSGMSAVNYRNVPKGEITVVSIGLQNMPYRNAVLFVLDMIPLRNNEVTELSVEVKEIVGLTSSEGLIENYRDRTQLHLQIGEPFLRGDADGDGLLSVADALLIKQHARALRPLVGTAFLAADVNGDSTVNAKDYLLVCKNLQKN